ncbi:T6SS immunity protein Tli4 family protein [Massilia sp. 9I]|uniref:T6SS immunity protein Tli4 family protein n=1 Tax=Massilia sp. 9I TaxID=2653152 RepID=UPI0012EFB397|nr:T6SS immunity protein Tli4 family protein [Massilia sp. 9I]VXB67768.1 exported hypothetical protein [Massilia sp. 9I]
MRRLYSVAVTLAVAGIAFAALVPNPSIGIEREKRVLTRLTATMKTVCVGRILIDIPAEAQIEFARSNIDGFDISALYETKTEFDERLAGRIANLTGTDAVLEKGSTLEQVEEMGGANGVTGKLIVHSRRVTEGTRARGLELERFRNEGVAVEALLHFEGVSFDFGAEYYDPDQVGNLPALIAKLVPNPGFSVPDEPGFCIDRAYVRDPLRAEQGEQTTMFVRLPSHPEIELMLILSAGTKPDSEGLLARSAAAESRLPFVDRMRIKKVRAAPREIAGLVGEELVRQSIEENQSMTSSFWWEVNGSEDNVLYPHLVLRMVKKGEIAGAPGSLSADAAVGLWDKISSSVRLRIPAKPLRDLEKPHGQF